MFLIMMVLLFSQHVFGAASTKQVKLKEDNGTVSATLETSASEPLTGSTFQEIIDRNHSNGLSTVFARTEDGCVYEAFAFRKQPDFEVIKTPGLRYFMLLSPKDDAACTIGSVAGMKRCSARKEFVEFMLCANNPDSSPVDRSLAYVKVGMSYAYDRGVRKRDVDSAFYWYGKALNQADNPQAKGQAHLHMGKLYRALAREHFAAASQQSASPTSKDLGSLYLADIDRLEGHVENARCRYLQLIQEASDSAIKQRAEERINQMLRSETPTDRDLYGLEDKRTDPIVYASPVSSRQFLTKSALYQMDRDVLKATAFVEPPVCNEQSAGEYFNAPSLRLSSDALS